MQEHDRYRWIDAKLKKVAESTSPAPGWYRDWSRLGRDVTEEERLAVFRAICTSRCLPEEAGFFLVFWMIDEIATQDAHHALHDFGERLEQAPPGYQQPRGRYGTAVTRIPSDNQNSAKTAEFAGNKGRSYGIFQVADRRKRKTSEPFVGLRHLIAIEGTRLLGLCGSGGISRILDQDTYS